jgi:hypothetical protein
MPFLLSGCEDEDSQNGIALAGKYLQTTGSGLGLIPDIRVKSVGALMGFVGSLMGSLAETQKFVAGQTLHKLPKDQAYRRTDDPTLIGLAPSFTQIQHTASYQTPIIAATGKRTIYLQCDADNFSLVWGINKRAYWIHNNMVDWLMKDDNCNFTVADHSHPVECSECGVPLYQQKYAYPGGDPEILDTPRYWSSQEDEQAWDNHLKHASVFRGCPPVSACGVVEAKKFPGK